HVRGICTTCQQGDNFGHQVSHQHGAASPFHVPEQPPEGKGPAQQQHQRSTSHPTVAALGAVSEVGGGAPHAHIGARRERITASEYYLGYYLGDPACLAGAQRELDRISSSSPRHGDADLRTATRCSTTLADA